MVDKKENIGQIEIICDDLSPKDQRALIFHLLYALDSFDYDLSLEAITQNFSRDFSIIISKKSNVFKQAQMIIENRAEIDKQILPLLSNWRFERLGTITRLIIRLGIWELQNTDTDSALIINECIELAKCFAEKDSYKFVNGVLDEFIKRKSTVDSNI